TIEKRRGQWFGRLAPALPTKSDSLALQRIGYHVSIVCVIIPFGITTCKRTQIPLCREQPRSAHFLPDLGFFVSKTCLRVAMRGAFFRKIRGSSGSSQRATMGSKTIF